MEFFMNVKTIIHQYENVRKIKTKGNNFDVVVFLDEVYLCTTAEIPFKKITDPLY